jgi:hypothetical protein
LHILLRSWRDAEPEINRLSGPVSAHLRSFLLRRFHRSSKQCEVEERIVQFQYFVVAEKDHNQLP